jgi:hypothetical protein
MQVLPIEGGLLPGFFKYGLSLGPALKARYDPGFTDRPAGPRTS